MKCRKSTKHAIVFIAALFAVITATSYSLPTEVKERKIDIKLSELPTEISKVVRDAFPNSRIIRIEKEIEGEDPGQYDFLMRTEGNEYEVEISSEGKIIEVKEVTSAEDAPTVGQGRKWTKSFDQENCSFSTVGRNRFFILEPGYQLVLRSSEEKAVITVLDETKKIGYVTTRLVEEREEKDGELVEVSKNFFAICKEHCDVFYFGEEVDDYKDGKIVSHSGAWRADEPKSKAGIIMPGTILLGARHYQEIAPNAMDRAEIISDDVTMVTPAKTFNNCISVEETSGLDPDEKCYKTYAPGVGLIQDEDMLLIRYGKPKEQIISFEDLPQAVRTTINKHAAGGKITSIEKDAVDGTVRYEAEVVHDGVEFNIIVSAEGKYLGTEKEEQTEGDHDENNNEDKDD